MEWGVLNIYYLDYHAVIFNLSSAFTLKLLDVRTNRLNSKRLVSIVDIAPQSERETSGIVTG